MSNSTTGPGSDRFNLATSLWSWAEPFSAVVATLLAIQLRNMTPVAELAKADASIKRCQAHVDSLDDSQRAIVEGTFPGFLNDITGALYTANAACTNYEGIVNGASFYTEYNPFSDVAYKLRDLGSRVRQLSNILLERSKEARHAGVQAQRQGSRASGEEPYKGVYSIYDNSVQTYYQYDPNNTLRTTLPQNQGGNLVIQGLHPPGPSSARRTDTIPLIQHTANPQYAAMNQYPPPSAQNPALQAQVPQYGAIPIAGASTAVAGPSTIAMGRGVLQPRGSWKPGQSLPSHSSSRVANPDDKSRSL